MLGRGQGDAQPSRLDLVLDRGEQRTVLAWRWRRSASE
jgi:hypothetical protein